ncbi:maleylacetate reductase [Cupriavidus lacunae]|uniref:maleylacetate reductase n=1 Tax=Cupriavidus lacunae TaxID=2666307 RepID=A0A370NIF5_9BURK|nr:maleylacetate reductase [Cupriavidus lacunae]RDK05338.1 maleylacetate reductase [Cupriavidus lacunae]
MNPFSYVPLPSRVIFGAGSVQQLKTEVLALGAKRALVLCTPQQTALASQLADALGEVGAGVYAGAVMHVPMESAVQAREVARERGADVCVAVGGGSTIGLGKAIALDSGVPILAVPTTYAGSEVTPIYGITVAGVKKTGRDLRVLPRTVIYDPDLTMTLPSAMTITSGINAMAHAAEGLYAQDVNPIAALMAEEGLRALAAALPILAQDGTDRGARSDALYGAWLSGNVLGSVGMALHHKLCHTLGGSFNLPHAELHTVVLPHVIGYNAPAVPTVAERIARAIGASSAGNGLQELARQCGAPLTLASIGMKREDLSQAAELACQNSYWNPRPFAHADVLALLERAFDGAPAEQD